jgi:outer membrane beta-barrel protein
MSKTVAMITMILVLLGAGGSDGWCQSSQDNETVYAVQNRIFHRDHELNFNIGYIADDDFFHVYPIGVGYTYHFDDHMAWEVARGQYMFNSDKDLKDILRDEFNVQPERFPKQTYMLHSHFVYSPLYGKHAVMNRGIINNEIYFFAGPGVVHYEWEFSTGESTTEDALSISFGAGLKYFLSEKWCLNFEIRDLINFREEQTENNIYFGIGVGYRFNMAPRKVQDDPTMNKLKRILNDG